MIKTDYSHSVILEPSKCVGCTYCIRNCPTEAIRLINGKASIIAKKCIDCGECIRTCPNHAKSAVTDSLDIIKNFKYSVALALPVLYGQFKNYNSPAMILSALKSIGFDDAYDTSIGSEITGFILKTIVKGYNVKPVISSTCPAILRLIQVRFPELIGNILDIETPVEISARVIKNAIAKKTGLDISDIGIILITPCTARVTSIRKPIGIDFSYIDGAISIKDIFGSMLKALPNVKISNDEVYGLTRRNMLCTTSGGQVIHFENENTMAVDGIHNAISILEKIEMDQLDEMDFIEIAACPKGCLGGPLVVENKFIALNKINRIARNLPENFETEYDTEKCLEMYKEGFIRLTNKIKPMEVTKLDPDLNISIKKMDAIRNLVSSLPGIDCGICGSPTCQSFAEDVITGARPNAVCPVMNILPSIKK